MLFEAVHTIYIRRALTKKFPVNSAVKLDYSISRHQDEIF